MKEKYKKEFMSYFRYLGEDALTVFDDLEPIDDARLLQEFMDVVEEERFTVDVDRSDTCLQIEGDVPEDLKEVLRQLLIFYWFDQRMEETEMSLTHCPLRKRGNSENMKVAKPSIQIVII